MRVVFTCVFAITFLAVVGCGSDDRKGGDAAPSSDDRKGGGAVPGTGDRKDKDKDAPGATSTSLDGTYRVVRLGINGLWTETGSDTAEAVIKGDTLTLRGGPWGRNPGKVYTIKTSASQSTIEMESTGRPGEKFLDRGIYKLEKDQLLIAVNRSPERPKDFEPRPGVAIYDLKKKK